MCRKGGRRCPHEKAKRADPTWREANNAKRREKYAAVKHTKAPPTMEAGETAQKAQGELFDLDSPDLRDNVEQFLSGDCAAYAVALSGETGWPIIAVVDDYSGDDEDPTAYGWIHVGCQSPDGMFVDALGPRDIDDVLDEYALYADPEGIYDGDVDAVTMDRVTADVKLGLGSSADKSSPVTKIRAKSLATQWVAKFSQSGTVTAAD